MLNFAQSQTELLMSNKIVSTVARLFRAIPTDKAKHLAVGFFIAAVVSVIFGYIAGVVAAAFAGAFKELYDVLSRKGTPEIWDFVCTVIGAAVFVVFSVVMAILFELLH